MKNNVSERLSEFISYLNISARRFEREIGVANGFVKAATSGMGVDKIRRIGEIYPSLNIDWLLTGEGEMLKCGAPLNVVENTTNSGNITQTAHVSEARLEVERLKAEVAVLREQNDKLLELLAKK